MVARWKFTDVHEKGPPPHSWTVPVNPNAGGSPQAEKQFNIMTTVGPRNVGVIQQGATMMPTLEFSGVILTQEHYEAFESWYDRQILLMLEDDLGRFFMGALQSFAPSRERRTFNYWFHTYSATFAVWAYQNASGEDRYGRWPGTIGTTG